jgi:hypothetical protein
MNLRVRGALFEVLAARTAVGLLLAFALAGCTRTITWEEEVPLNTGETIWIERSMPWELKGGFGNPFDIAMRPTREQTIRFTYAGKEYLYVGRANVRWIAISEAKQPVLAFKAGDFAWDAQNHFLCVVPHYVQLVPDNTGKQWTWPSRIEPWLYHMKANVMVTIPTLTERNQRRYTSNDRKERDTVYQIQVPQGFVIDPLYEGNGCLHKFAS